METSLDLSRWRDTPRGVGYRRWTIVSQGLAQLLRTRFFRFLLMAAWSGALLIAATGFAFGQAFASGGWLETLAAKFGPRAEAIVSGIGALVLMYPDICVRGVFTEIFWVHSFAGLWLSLVALTAVVPQLIARDRASNALTVYLSRPLTSGDYLLGKLGIVAGVLALLWTGPLACGWLLSMLFAPNVDFVIHSVGPLLRALAFHGVALVALTTIALGVSALSRSSRSTVAIWLGLWLILGAIGGGAGAPEWLQRASFSRNLAEVRREILNLDDVLIEAGNTLPLFNARLSHALIRAGEKVRGHEYKAALAALAGMAALSSFVFLRRIRPE